jgi:hypothetical protein
MTWQEAQALIAAQQMPAVIDAPAPPTQQISPAIDAQPWPPAHAITRSSAGDRTCPYCGRVLSRVVHLKRHLNTCPERYKPEIAT